MNDVEFIRDPARAAQLLEHPLRLRIMEIARAPLSSAEIADRLAERRQNVNYHVRKLERAGFLVPVDERRARNIVSRRVVVSARRYVLSPTVLGPVAADDPRAVQDGLSAAYLIALAGRTITEVGAAVQNASETGRDVPTLSLEASVRFTDARQRAAFTQALTAALTEIVRTHTAAPTDASAQPYRLVFGCHPIPPMTQEAGA